MKQLLLFSFVILTMISCKKSSNNIIQKASITGKWYTVKTIDNTYANGTLFSSDTTKYSKTDYIIFNSDNTGSQSESGFISSLTYTIIGNNITVNYPQMANQKASTSNGTIKGLTNNSLELSFASDGNGVPNDTYDVFYSK